MFKIEEDLRSANVARTIRFTDSMFDQLNKIAAQNNISFNHLVLQCCKYALDHMEEEEK